jgi:predicted signal transduction protein with EAL and GGDEF domain
MTDSRRDQVPGAIAAIRRALASLMPGFLTGNKRLAFEVDELRQQLDEKEAEILRLEETRARLETNLVTMRTRDSLTGLPSRDAFVDALDDRLGEGYDGVGFWVGVVRLSQFERLSHSLGASAAADLMVQVSARIEAVYGAAASISRVGDQEIGFQISHEDAHDAAVAGAKLLRLIEDRFTVGKQGIYLHAVIGLAEVRKGARGGSELLDQAGLAADEAIANGEKWVAFRVERHEEVIGLMQLEADLQGAVRNDEFRLYYQPVVSVMEHGIVGIEALIRWFHPSGTVILPERFIPIAESKGDMATISEWVFRTGIDQIKRWQSLFDTPFYISMNLTPRDLNADFCETIFRLIDAAGISPDQVGVEITETAVVRDFKHAAQLIGRLSEHGVRVLLDDFGTGYSSLSYLRELPFNYVKIDKSFVHRMAFDSRDFGMVRSIISLVQYLEMECVAEGIETQEQRDLIAMIDCDYWQGNLFSKAVPATEIEELLGSGATSVARRTME